METLDVIIKVFAAMIYVYSIVAFSCTGKSHHGIWAILMYLILFL